MIILYMENNQFGVVKFKSFTELISNHNEFDCILKVFEEYEGMSPTDYFNNYGEHGDDTMVLVTKQPVTVNNIKGQQVIIEHSWLKHTRPIFLMTGTMLYERVFNIDKDGLTYEDFIDKNLSLIFHEVEDTISSLENKLSLERGLYNRFKTITHTETSQDSLTESLIMTQEKEAHVDVLKHFKDKIYNTEDELDKFKEFLLLTKSRYDLV